MEYVTPVPWYVCVCLSSTLWSKDPPWPSIVVTMPGSYSQVRVTAGSPRRLAWSLYKGAPLWMAVYGPSATERPLRAIREEKGISSHFSSRYDLSCRMRRKTPLLPSFLSGAKHDLSGLWKIMSCNLHCL